jgi:hypothetical protein
VKKERSLKKPKNGSFFDPFCGRLGYLINRFPRQNLRLSEKGPKSKVSKTGLFGVPKSQKIPVFRPYMSAALHQTPVWSKTGKRVMLEIGGLFLQTLPLKFNPKKGSCRITMVATTNPLYKSSKTRILPIVSIALSPGRLEKHLFLTAAVSTGSVTTAT